MGGMNPAQDAEWVTMGSLLGGRWHRPVWDVRAKAG